MTRAFSVLFCLVQLVHGASSNSTSSDRCPPPDGTTRSLWCILGSCALTLLICVWHTVHFGVPRKEQEKSIWFKILCSLAAFFLPEVMVAYAAQEWYIAHTKVKLFDAKGYKWSMTHSFFAEMGGFVYRNEHGVEVRMDCDRFLELCERNEIMNPIITVEDIRDKSKSDWIGKMIFAVHLTWFMVQVIVRGSAGLAVTLVELDTVCMAVLSLVVIGLWWYKPLRPERPHIFYLRGEVKQEVSGITMEGSSQRASESADNQKEVLSDAWKPEPTLLRWPIACWTWIREPMPPHWLMACWRRVRKRNEIGTMPPDAQTQDDLQDISFTSLVKLFRTIIEFNRGDAQTFTIMCLSLGVTWLVLGGLHLIAWNFEFPTRAERITWRVASFILASSSVITIYAPDIRKHSGDSLALYEYVLFYGVIFRAMLVGLMLANLRALPCSAYQTVSWTSYIPHL